jgi:hypothetical protein
MSYFNNYRKREDMDIDGYDPERLEGRTVEQWKGKYFWMIFESEFWCFRVVVQQNQGV